MRKKILAGILLVLTGFFAAGFAIREAEAAPKAQTICPVLGDPIDKSLYVDYQGYRIYFCCKGCPDEFKKNPAKYMKILKESGVTLEKSAGINSVIFVTFCNLMNSVVY